MGLMWALTKAAGAAAAVPFQRLARPAPQPAWSVADECTVVFARRFCDSLVTTPLLPVQAAMNSGYPAIDAHGVPTQPVPPRPDFRGAWIGDVDAVDDPATAIVLYFSGGGYVMGGLKASADLAAKLVKAANARGRKVAILVVDYALAPTNPYPAALNEAVAAYTYVVTERGLPPSRIAVVGVSAGGGLAVALAKKLRDQGALAQPALLVLASPWVTLGTDAAAFTRNHALDLLSKPFLESASAQYLNGAPLDPYNCPSMGSLKGLGRAWIDAGANELFVDDITAFADAYNRDAGDGMCQLTVHPGGVHAGMMLDQRKPTGPVLAGAREAFDGCVDAFLTVAAPAASVAAA